MTRRQHARRFMELLGAAIVVALLFGTVPSASAKDFRANCRERIEKAEFKLEQSIRTHGYASHQADQRRRQLRDERERCWKRDHSWWDGRAQSWRDDQDWDRFDGFDRDHDRDHDRH